MIIELKSNAFNLRGNIYFNLIKDMAEYFYPDENDEITCGFISEKEPFEGYWHESEKSILRIIKSYIKNSNGTLLDAGCGDGRLIPEFEPLFNKIIGIDPDVKRIEKAINNPMIKRGRGKIEFKVVFIEDFDPNQKFDVILCSHVIQHIPTENVEVVLKKFQDILKENGLLFILTIQSKEENDIFIKSFIENNKTVELEISQENFNDLVSNQEKILPIHLFSQNTLGELLKKHGFEILEKRVFHVLNQIPCVNENIDEIVNADPDMQKKFGRDIFIASRKINIL